MSEPTNQPSEAEILEYKAKQLKYFEDNTELLEKQAHYYELLAKIEISKLRALEAKLQYASIMSQSKKETKDESNSSRV